MVENPRMSPTAALLLTSGSVTVAIATPNTPSGNCIRRNGVVQPRHRAVALVAGERGVDHHVDLHRARRDDRRTHQPQDGPHALVLPAEVEWKRYPARRSEGNCTANCKNPPISVPAAMPNSARLPNLWSSMYPMPTPPTMEPRLKKLDASAGAAKMCFAFSIPIASAENDTSRMNGYMIRVSETVSSNFPGTAWNPPPSTSMSCGRQRDAQQRHHAHEHEHQRGHLVGQTPRGGVAFELDFLGKRRDERRRERAFGKQVAQKIGRAEGGQKRVRPRARAEQPGKNLVARQPSTRLHITASPTMPAARVLPVLLTTGIPGRTVIGGGGGRGCGRFGGQAGIREAGHARTLSEHRRPRNPPPLAAPFFLRLA